MKDRYNWWTDPKNKEQVDLISWWTHERNKEFFPLPISVIEGDGHWTATINDDTKKLLGDTLSGCASSKTKEGAIEKMFLMLELSIEYTHECMLRYQRWVPFRNGDWSYRGGRWFVIFGFHVYFRYGKGMKGGWYLPFTKLNVSIYSEWRIWKDYKKEKMLNTDRDAQECDATEAK